MRRSWLLLALLPACVSPPPGTPLPRRGEEIMVCGRLFHVGVPVVLWLDPGGYDAYRVERRFVPLAEATWRATVAALGRPVRYGLRRALPDAELERIHREGWRLRDLQRVVDQFVIHYDVCGTSRRCFQVLHDKRGLSVHFLLDLDGTVYQTLDLKERAWHATRANDRSIGVEIAHIGAYPADRPSPLERWYRRDGTGRLRVVLPEAYGSGGLRTQGFIPRPAREELIVGEIQGQRLKQYDFTPEQYESLIRLTAALCRIFPRLRCDYPRGPDGKLLRRVLSDVAFARYRGLLGHFHVQRNKIDPGPAFQWDRVIHGARRLLGEEAAP